MSPEVRECLEDAVGHAEKIKEFVSGYDLETYSVDAKPRMAVERAFEIVGEALNRIKKKDESILESISDYRNIVSFRNMLAHAYDHVDDKIVWGIIEGDLDRLIKEIRALL